MHRPQSTFGHALNAGTSKTIICVIKFCVWPLCRTLYPVCTVPVIAASNTLIIEIHATAEQLTCCCILVLHFCLMLVTPNLLSWAKALVSWSLLYSMLLQHTRTCVHASQSVKLFLSLWLAAGFEWRQLKLSTQAESKRHSPRSIFQAVPASRGACGSPLPS